jgi:hypothetical protein
MNNTDAPRVALVTGGSGGIDEIRRILSLPVGDKPLRSVVDAADAGVDRSTKRTVTRRSRSGAAVIAVSIAVALSGCADPPDEPATTPSRSVIANDAFATVNSGGRRCAPPQWHLVFILDSPSRPSAGSVRSLGGA